MGVYTLYMCSALGVRKVLRVKRTRIFLKYVRRYEYLWEESNYMLKVVQTAAVFEIFHILLGIVKSSLSTSFLQGEILQA